MSADPRDRSYGYEAVASPFIAAREGSRIGVATVRAWARLLPKGSSIPDLGCGSGVPISQALSEDGFRIYGIDASPSLAAAFCARFPDAPIACETVEGSRFFGRTFDGIVAVGLLFLLPADAQRDLIRRVAIALNPGGCFLFTAPAQECTWPDVLTGQPSLSLGTQGYRATVAEAGLRLLDEYLDEGENYYYDTCRDRPSASTAFAPDAF